jgi:predicted Zn-dependent protease
MAEVAARIVVAAFALALAAGLAVELHAHDVFADAQAVAKQPQPTRAAIDHALHDAGRVSKLEPGGGAFLLAAGLNLRAQRPAAAARSAERATKRDPQNFAAWLTLGVARQSAGDNPGAKAAYARVRALNPLYGTPG